MAMVHIYTIMAMSTMATGMIKKKILNDTDLWKNFIFLKFYNPGLCWLLNFIKKINDSLKIKGQ